MYAIDLHMDGVAANNNIVLAFTPEGYLSRGESTSTDRVVDTTAAIVGTLTSVVGQVVSLARAAPPSVCPEQEQELEQIRDYINAWRLHPAPTPPGPAPRVRNAAGRTRQVPAEPSAEAVRDGLARARARRAEIARLFDGTPAEVTGTVHCEVRPTDPAKLEQYTTLIDTVEEAGAWRVRVSNHCRIPTQLVQHVERSDTPLADGALTDPAPARPRVTLAWSAERDLAGAAESGAERGSFAYRVPAMAVAEVECFGRTSSSGCLVNPSSVTVTGAGTATLAQSRIVLPQLGSVRFLPMEDGIGVSRVVQLDSQTGALLRIEAANTGLSDDQLSRTREALVGAASLPTSVRQQQRDALERERDILNLRQEIERLQNPQAEGEGD